MNASRVTGLTLQDDGLVIRRIPASLRRDLCSQSPSPKLKPPRRRLARVWAGRATPKERGLGYVHRAQRVLNGVSGSRYVVMQRQRSVSTIRQPLMSTAVTFAALTESRAAVTATCAVAASRKRTTR